MADGRDGQAGQGNGRRGGTEDRKVETAVHEYSMDGRLRNAAISPGQVITPYRTSPAPGVNGS